MAESKSFEDGHYQFADVKDAVNKDFENEKDFCDYIERNIEEFTRDCLGFEYETHVREFQIGGISRRYKSSKRVDFLIKTKTGEIVCVECKCPVYISELAAAIGQVLGYMTFFELQEQKVDYAFIVSTKIDWYMPAIIGKYKLPIGFIAMDKSKHLTFIK